MPDGFEVGLGPDEVAVARLIGTIRAESCLHAGSVDRVWNLAPRAGDGEVEQDQQAAGAEIAVAKLLDRWVQAWGSVGAANATADVAGCQVRWTRHDRGHLPVHGGGEDDPAQKFILVTGLLPVYVVRGWLYGHQVLAREDWRWNTLPSRPYMGPQDALRPVWHLGWFP